MAKTVEKKTKVQKQDEKPTGNGADLQDSIEDSRKRLEALRDSLDPHSVKRASVSKAIAHLIVAGRTEKGGE